MATIGLNISGGEFGGSAGTHNQDYHYPNLKELEFYKSHGVDLIRIPFRWERLQDALGGALDVNGDLALIKQVLVNAASLGMDVILDNHNYGRYNGIALGAAGGPTAAQFADFWQKMAAELKDYPALLGYDLMNEPHSMPTATIWKESAQAATDAIRKVDMDNIIYIEGNAWSGAHSWLKHNSDLIINDPANKIVYQAHQYFDLDSSGKYRGSYDEEKAYAMVGVDRLAPFVEWLQANNLKGMIGEFGVPSDDPRWLEVLRNTLEYMEANNLDGTAWGGGTWWSTTYSMYTAEPGHADSAYMDVLEQYFGPYEDVFAKASQLVSVPPAVTINDVAANETAGSLVFTLTRTGDLSGSSSVNYATRDGTATGGSDYSAASGTVNFAAGQATATVTIQLNNDASVENTETLSVELSGGTNITINDGVGIGTINSDDVAAAPTNGSITGTDTGDYLTGTSGPDIINGLGGSDVINGGGGADRLTGGSGSDRFVFDAAGNANWDLITDFEAGSDLLDLRSIDANSRVRGDQKFNWLDNGNFSGKPGQLREYNQDGKHFVAGDTNGDGVADFVIEVAGSNNLSSIDILF